LTHIIWAVEQFTCTADQVSVILLFHPRGGVQSIIYVCFFICLSVLSVHSHNSKTAQLNSISCACCLWPWLGPPLTTLRCVISCVVCCLPYETDFCETVLFQTANVGVGKAWW